MSEIVKKYTKELADVIRLARAGNLLTATSSETGPVAVEGIALSEGRVAWSIKTLAGQTLADGVREADDTDSTMSAVDSAASHAAVAQFFGTDAQKALNEAQAA